MQPRQVLIGYNERCRVFQHSAPSPIGWRSDVTPLQASLPFDEEWHQIPGFPDYAICRDGRVKRTVADRFGRLTGRPLCCHEVSRYMQITLFRDGRRRMIKLHIVLLEAFVGPCPSPRHQGCHNDGDSLNNDLDNLRWDTPEGNQADRLLHGTHLCGSNNPRAKLTVENVLAIRAELAGFNHRTQAEIAASYGVTQGMIGHINRNKSWRLLV